jgi:hypothetical protein
MIDLGRAPSPMHRKLMSIRVRLRMFTLTCRVGRSIMSCVCFLTLSVRLPSRFLDRFRFSRPSAAQTRSTLTVLHVEVFVSIGHGDGSKTAHVSICTREEGKRKEKMPYHILPSLFHLAYLAYANRREPNRIIPLTGRGSYDLFTPLRRLLQFQPRTQFSLLRIHVKRPQAND